MYYSYSCGIDLGNYFVVTGGSPNLATVTKYSQAGFDQYLETLNIGRKKHACSKFVDDIGNTVSYDLKLTRSFMSSCRHYW